MVYRLFQPFNEDNLLLPILEVYDSCISLLIKKYYLAENLVFLFVVLKKKI